ncbi:MAG TPA: alpha/beta hydrolase [Candidatus Ozemobacteraceae bacterium]|nr:alpha/beta hydrolase [Candidatus Ozemobacteraceae bacterium]
MKHGTLFRLALALTLLGAGGSLLAVAVSNILTTPRRVGPPSKPSSLAGTAFTCLNRDGTRIAGRWFPGHPDAGAVLLCHGHCVDHRHLMDMADFLHSNGYNILALDFRAHGKSGGAYTSIGLHEGDDIAAVIAAAETQGLLPAGMPLAAYGRSMGAAALANGSGRLPRITAFLLESSFAELRIIAARDILRVSGIPDSPLIDILFAFSRWRTGYDYASNRPVEGIRGVASRPILLIHDALDVRATREDHDRLRAAVPHAEELVIPDAPHVRGHQPPPAPFEPVVLDFLRRSGVLPAPR